MLVSMASQTESTDASWEGMCQSSDQWSSHMDDEGAAKLP